MRFSWQTMVNRLLKEGISKLFQRLGVRVPLDGKRVSAHNCRRYMATQLKMGRSPLDVQRQMGHTTLTMTNHYASLVTET
jgi:integrase